MDIKPEDFPLYGLLDALGAPGVERARTDMAAACGGDDNAAYGLTMGLHGVAASPGIENHIPGLTEDIKQATYVKCREVWATLAARGHAQSQNLMALLNKPSGPGTPQP